MESLDFPMFPSGFIREFSNLGYPETHKSIAFPIVSYDLISGLGISRNV